MQITNVYVRFFRSFNYDYLRKNHPGSAPSPWDIWDGSGWYPFVDVALERGITTVVGANESGKSQLLSAIKRALTGEAIVRGDFCRYSTFFAVDESIAVPEFGLRLSGLDDSDRGALDKASGGELPDVDAVTLIRTKDGSVTLHYEIAGAGWASTPVTDEKALRAGLPTWFEIDSEVPLPASVPIAYLRTGDLAGVRTRAERSNWYERLFGDDAAPTAAAVQVVVDELTEEQEPGTRTAMQLRLADDLLVKVAGISRAAFEELGEAVAKGQEGYANGLIDKINVELSKALNFTKYWSQDRDFRLKLTLRDRDVVFTVKDRTGTEYSFDERSGGLKYFLSYLVQYLRHDFSATERQVLLMDEPDAFLSSTGQRDLLRIFEGFAFPEDPNVRGCQVVYVTHSPFLIDKNHGDRIRVLEKGQGDEGTRVVQNVARNHYEPLRSAFGGFVAETTFIGNCNLFLEGTSDQVLLAGMSAWLRRRETSQLDNIDLNTLTLVPADGASHIPYLAYLARGRDVDRPAVLVLLDSDAAGDEARAVLGRGGARGKQVVEPRYVLQLGSLPAKELSLDTPHGVGGIEDLLPASITLAAAQRYAAEFVGADAEAAAGTVATSSLSITKKKGMFGAVEAALAAVIGEGFHLDKIGLARSVIDVLPDADPDEVARLEQNFRCLFRALRERQRHAERAQQAERTTDRVKRELRSFRINHPTTCTREDAQVLVEIVDGLLDDSVYVEELRLRLALISKDHNLREDPTTPVSDLSRFLDDLTGLAYEEVQQAQAKVDREATNESASAVVPEPLSYPMTDSVTSPAA